MKGTVQMSTVHETIALHHMGIRVGAVSCITNLAAGISPTRLHHEEVKQVVQARQSTFFKFLESWIKAASNRP